MCQGIYRQQIDEELLCTQAECIYIEDGAHIEDVEVEEGKDGVDDDCKDVFQLPNHALRVLQQNIVNQCQTLHERAFNCSRDRCHLCEKQCTQRHGIYCCLRVGCGDVSLDFASCCNFESDLKSDVSELV